MTSLAYIGSLVASLLDRSITIDFQRELLKNAQNAQKMRNPPKTTLWSESVRFSHRTVSITLNPIAWHARMTWEVSWHLPLDRLHYHRARIAQNCANMRNPPKTTLWSESVRFSHRTVSITLNPITWHARMTWEVSCHLIWLAPLPSILSENCAKMRKNAQPPKDDLME